MSKGKILLFTTDFPPSVGGGISTHSHFMVESLSKLGWEFIVLSEYYIESSEEEINSYSKQNGYPIYKLPPAPSLFSYFKKIIFSYKIYRKYKPNIILGTGRHTSWLAAIISFLVRKPLVTIGHGTEFTQQTAKNDFKWNRLAYGRSEVLIAISEYTKNVIIQCGIKPKKIEVIHNAANENYFQVLPIEEIEKFKISKSLTNRSIILTVGALTERKGQKTIIKSLPHLTKEFPNILYVAIGLPNIKTELLDLSMQLGVAENVLFPGIVSQEELLNWINACDFFAMTSINNEGDYEGYGIAVIEAALCKKTSIVSDSAGLKEAVSDNITGLIVKENSEIETANAIRKLLNDHLLLDTLAMNAYQNAIKNGTFGKKAIEYDTVFSNLILKK